MTKKVFAISNNIISSLGFSTDENFKNISSDISGIKQISDKNLYIEPFMASQVDTNLLNGNFSKISDADKFTRFEKLIILSVNDAVKNINIDLKSEKTIFIISTTKGNVDVFESEKQQKFGLDRIKLWSSAKIIKDFYGLKNMPVVISNACISGILAIINAQRFLSEGKFENAVVVGADIISKFVVSGFMSFKSISEKICKPFDLNRNGLSLGEGSATVVLSTNKNLVKDKILIGDGASSNDANHISGPSRTGEGLYLSIKNVLNKTDKKIDYISAHGTATLYNDDMESKAIFRNNLQDVPVNSFKGYFGHTLGAAGVLETVLTIKSMQSNLLINTLGFNELGTVEKINVVNKTQKADLQTCLKIGSGFRGCNAALLISKN